MKSVINSSKFYSSKFHVGLIGQSFPSPNFGSYTIIREAGSNGLNMSG